MISEGPRRLPALNAIVGMDGLPGLPLLDPITTSEDQPVRQPSRSLSNRRAMPGSARNTARNGASVRTDKYGLVSVRQASSAARTVAETDVNIQQRDRRDVLATTGAICQFFEQPLRIA